VDIHHASPRIATRNAYYLKQPCYRVGSPTQPIVKLAFLLGSFLILFPLLRRTIDAVDNSMSFTIIAIGILIVIIGELNRVRVEEASPFN